MTKDKNTEAVEQELAEETAVPECEEIKEEAAQAEAPAEEKAPEADPALAALNDKYLRICARWTISSTT